ncbi:alpha-ketoglutarate-dependent dioxygenase AlkB [Raineyella fluvialis]|uniref:Alpha-ketoglutarate-dependent dioxygenase AlkB n=1 Tax=Raineyella fluvialis TaxID=2662261 RepID=A0A5Q2FDI1_9ACTN|nr:alpha-ketoglutarate-dependent dioxygenase AlkB [Raineyella fluvialis]QGF24869.1 alpha-ketoglutarate-dependent dioxygenase AlkB [Raineyella fluvialis]
MVQGTLFDLQTRVGPSPAWDGPGVRRVPLRDGAWIDLRPGWLSGAEELFNALLPAVPWRAERRVMYDAVVDVPRLTRFYGGGEDLPHRAIAECRDALSAHCRAELGEEFVSVGMCLYRDGRDSVAWHGDRVGRSRTEDTMVAILSLGATRPLMLRPRGGGRSLSLPLGAGDLVVMGGSCQRTWEHCIPKTRRTMEPRISVQFRPEGVR